MPGQQLGRHQKATNALWHPVQPCLAQHALTLHKACLTIDQDVCQVGSTPHLSTILGGYTQRLHDLQSYFSARPEVRSHKINTREVAGHFAGLQRSACQIWKHTGPQCCLLLRDAHALLSGSPGSSDQLASIQ